MRELTIMGWNINGRSGYSHAYAIPPFVADKIMKEETDIVVLTEFVMTAGWHHIKSVLEKKYCIFSSYTSNQNGVLIAIKKNIEGLDIKSARVSTEMNTDQTEKPNFLQVTVSYNEQPIFIIGTRIRYDDKEKQLNALYDHLNSLNKKECKVICIGDNNATPRFLWKEIKSKCKDYKLDSPSYNTDNDTYKRNNKEYCCWSYVHKDGEGIDKGKASLDHIISNGLTVTSSDYLWDFVNEENGYKKDHVIIQPEDYKSDLVGLPDHAILIAEVMLKKENNSLINEDKGNVVVCPKCGKRFDVGTYSIPEYCENCTNEDNE